ncbi:MAG: hypothetical protein ACTSW1_14270 [Candidatus Hodarchaeales archaeon]
MKMRYYLFGLLTMSVLVFGLGAPVIAKESMAGDDPMNDGPFPGTYYVDFDFDLINNWLNGPTLKTPEGLVNTNLYYNVTEMISPLDQYFNAGFITGGEEGGPMFAIDGTLEDSDLIVKIINDQTSDYGRLLDFQGSLILGNNITLSWMFPEEEPVPPEAGLIEAFMPDNFTIPEGSGLPFFPLIKMATNFSQFSDLSQLFWDFGYEGGMPFFIPAVFYVDDLADAAAYWTNKSDINQILNIDEASDTNFSTSVSTLLNESGFDLLIELQAFNDTFDFGNFSVNAHWGIDGFLSDFSFNMFFDDSQNGILEDFEEYLIVFELDSMNQDQIPISVGDEGEYIIDIYLDAWVDLENQTMEDMLNSLLTAISDSINELNGYPLLNYTVTSMDGLFFTLDGYLLDLPKFIQDRLPFFGPEPAAGLGSQEPLPPVDDYYQPLMMNFEDRGYHPDALNLFDSSVYMNSTLFYELFDGWMWWNDETQQFDHNPLFAWDNRSMEIPNNPGIVNAMVFKDTDWWGNYDHDLAFIENLDNMIGMAVYDGPVTYVEKEDNYYDIYDERWYNHTWTDAWIYANDTEPFDVDQPYVLVMEISEMPETNYTSYLSIDSIFKMLGGAKEPMPAGIGAQDEGPMLPFDMPMDPRRSIPFPARTPDWDIVGTLPTFLESITDTINDIITNPDLIDMLSSMTGDDPGDSLSINDVDLGFDWEVNDSHAGMSSFFMINGTVIDNDTGMEAIVDFNVTANTDQEIYWDIDGYFDSLGSSSNIELNLGVEYWPEPPNTTTTTTVPTNETDTNTTAPPDTSIPPELTPGFETLAVLSGLIAVPVFFKKRR